MVQHMLQVPCFFLGGVGEGIREYVFFFFFVCVFSFVFCVCGIFLVVFMCFFGGSSLVELFGLVVWLRLDLFGFTCHDVIFVS